MHFSSIITLLASATAASAAVAGTPVELAKRATCTPTSGGDASVDDTTAIAAALSSCGNGGTIVIPAGVEYWIRSVLDFSDCVSCDFQVEGTLKVSDDLDYWEGKTAIFLLSGVTGAKIRSLTGSGLIDGNGQAAWDEFASNSDYDRPTLFYITGSSDITVSNIYFKSAPNVFHSAAGSSTNIVYEDITLKAVSSSDNAAKNTDGWDIGPASYVTMSNITVTNDDDCVAFKNGANYVTISDIKCTGSHGLSVGSLGGSTSSFSVKNIYVKNAQMVSSTKAAGIKLYPGGSSYSSSVVVSNVTWDTVTVDDCDYAFQIQSCYDEDSDYCDDDPSAATLTDIVIKDFSGTTSSKYEPVTANVDCPADGTCDLTVSGWTVESPEGSGEVLCANVPSDSGFTCTDAASG